MTVAVSTKTSALAVHPAAELFPMMDRADLNELADDIKRNGLVDPIITWQGQLLDGRNRLAACEIAGIDPQFSALKRLPGGDAIAYVMAKNLKRRHLTAPQRAVLAVQAAELMAGEAAERKHSGKSADGSGGGRGHKKPEGSKVPKDSGKTAAKAAKIAGAGEKQVQAMTAVKKTAPEVFKAVQAGEVKTVADAKRLAAVEDPKERRAALQLVKNGEPARAAIETVSAPTPAGTPTDDQRMATIERAMNKARPLAENLNHQLECVYTNARKIGVDKIGGLGGFRLGVELTALKATFNKLEGLFQ